MNRVYTLFKLRTISIIIVSLISFAAYTQEIANNGIDDDNDGYVDCFDSELYGTADCGSFYFGQPIPDCREKPPVLDSYTLELKFKTNKNSHPLDQRCGVFVGDMNNDNIPDLIGKAPKLNNYSGFSQTYGRLYIFHGVDGSLIQGIDQVSTTHAFSQVCIGDVDEDGYGDIFVVENDRYIRRYEYNHTDYLAGDTVSSGAIFTSSQTASNAHNSPQLADFDGDGTPEVYTTNMIFNAITGTRLVSGSGAENQGSIPGLNDSWPIAYDVYQQGDLIPNGGGSTFGSNADGLELIMGNEIYLVDLGDGTEDNGSLTLALEATISDISSSSNGGDGFTSIADLNGDHKIDVIVTGMNSSGKAAIFAYDPYTDTQIGSTYQISSASTNAGRCNVADFDNDGDLEIGTAGKNIYMVLEYNDVAGTFEKKWDKNPVDDGSQMTGSTVFDFEGDGAAEVVYSEEENLFIWKGTDGTELSKVTSQSGTRTDYPLVADADGDGQAEIVITAQDRNGPSNTEEGYISVYRSKDAPWVAARESWNQHGYFVTNIGNELIIPKEQQAIASPYFSDDFNNAFNGFLVQTTYLTEYGDPTFAVGDLTTENVLVDLDECVSHDSVEFTVTLENNGDWKAPRNTPIAIFDGDPYVENAIYLGTIYTPENVEVGGTLDINHTVKDPDGDGTMDLYVLANHYEETLVIGDALAEPLDSVNSPTLECNYVNNVGFIVSITNCSVNNRPQIDLDRDNSEGTTGINYEDAFAVKDVPGDVVPVAISDYDILIADDDDTEMDSARVTLTNHLDGADESLILSTNGSTLATNYGFTVTTSYQNIESGDVDSILIDIKGVGTLGEYEQVIREIQYQNTKSNADITKTDRLIEVYVSDGINYSDTAVTTMLLKIEPTLDLDDDNSSGATGRDYSTSFTEGTTTDLTIVDSDVSIVTDGSINLESVTVQLSNILDGSKENLSIDTITNPLPGDIKITTDYENGIGIIELSGDGTTTQYEQALQYIVYNNISLSPDETSRIINVVVNDGYLESLTATTTIQVTATNSAPAIAGPLTELLYNEGDGSVSVLSYIDITDADDTNIESAVIELTNRPDGSNEAIHSTHEGNTVNGITVSTYSSATGQITLTGSATLSEYEAVIASLTYENTGLTDGTTRVFQITVNDGDDDSNVYSRNIEINRAPSITSGATTSVNENTTTVMTVTSDDPDSGDTEAFTITGGADSGEFNINPSSGALTFISAPDFDIPGDANSDNDYIVQVTVTDSKGLTDVITITITVNDVNEAPSSSDNEVTTDEDVDYDFATSDFVFSDPDAGDELAGILVKSLPASGQLYVDTDGDGEIDAGEEVNDEDVIPKTDLDNNRFKFKPVTNENGNDYTTFNFKVNDGSLDASSENTITIDVDPVNDEPTASNESVTTDEDTEHTFASSEFDNNYNDIDGDVFAGIKITGLPANGRLYYNSIELTLVDLDFVIALADISNLSYIPAEDEYGNSYTNFNFKVFDGTDYSIDYSMTINVTDVNDAPVANDDSDSVNEGESVTIDLDDNDTDIDGTLDITNIVLGTATNGSLVNNGDGTVTYTHNGSETTLDSLTYTINDDDGATSNSATVYITINPQNDAPVANDDTGTVDEGSSITIDLDDNDTDVDGTLDVTSIVLGTATNGSLVNNGDGTLTYTHNGSETTSDSFTYTINDDDGATSNSATVSITITPQNDAPVANDDTGTVDEGSSITIDLDDNDTDVDGTLDVTSIVLGTATNGSLVNNGDGTVTYTHNGSETISDSFTYTIDDNDGVTSNSATVNITVTPVNDMPVANNDSESVDEEGTLNGDVSTNDVGLDEGPITFTVQTDVTNGSLTFNNDGTYTYEPNTGFNGIETFTYRVCDVDGDCSTGTVTITVNPINDTPGANDDSESVNQDGTLNGDVSTNDTGLEDEPITFSVITDVINGTLTLNNNGTYTYIPNSGFNGSDSFVYEVCDTDGECDQATVSINIDNVDDIPDAIDDSENVDEDSNVTIDVLTNDTGLEDGGITVSVVSNPANGAVVINGDNSITYTPNGGFNGNDTFTYEVCDTDGDCDQATVTITVNPVDDTPNANDDSESTDEDGILNSDVSTNDTGLEDTPVNYSVLTDVSNGTLTLNSDGTFTYEPNDGFNGTDSFVYEVCDEDGDCSTATVTITVNSVNDVPVANDDSETINQDSTLDSNVSANDSGLEDTPVTFSVQTDVSNGTLVLNTDGSYTYTPDVGFYGTDSFIYQVCDADGDCSTATVSITVVQDVNQKPVANDDEDSVLSGETLNGINLLDNDSDPDGDNLEINTSPIDIPLRGMLTIHTDGTFTYLADVGYNGTDIFTYEVCDDGSPVMCDTASVTITVTRNEDDHEVLDGFSPNGDGTNDEFVISWIDQYEKVSIQIFNRWGNVVFSEDTYLNNWDGKANTGMSIGNELPVGTYYYIIHIHDTGEKMNGYIYLNR